MATAAQMGSVTVPREATVLSRAPIAKKVRAPIELPGLVLISNPPPTVVDGLQLGQNVGGLVPEGSGNWFHFSYNTSSQVNVTVKGPAGCILAAREGYQPTMNNYSAIAVGPSPSLLLATSPSTKWFLGVFAEGGCSYTISTSICKYLALHFPEPSR